MNKTVQDTAKKIAKQLAWEPLEILKESKEQITGSGSLPAEPAIEKPLEESRLDSNTLIKNERQMQALGRELDDIRKQNLFKDLQRRISQGEEIPLEDYPELSLEQKQVLKAQMEAVKARTQQPRKTSLVEPGAKKGRRLFSFGKKQEVKKQQTRVERVNPPSG